MTRTRSCTRRGNVPRSTLDQKHTEVITNFTKMDNSLPTKKRRLIKMESELDRVNRIVPSQYTSDDIRYKAKLKDSISKLQREIMSIENCDDQLSYITNTFPFLVDYYNTNTSNDAKVDEAILDECESIGGKRSVLSYLFAGDTTEKDNNHGNATQNPVSNVSNIYDGYLQVTDYSHHSPKQIKKYSCPVEYCDGEQIKSENDGYLICDTCGASEEIYISTEKPNYNEPLQDSGTYAYKRINHLTEILSQLQAKESTDIPKRVFESVYRELRIRNTRKESVDLFKLRRILKKLNLRKYYEHVPHILQIINGKEPPNFSRQDEMTIKHMFKDIQKPFSIYCPKDRKNFLNYSYVLHKFCELLCLDDYIGYFPLLKNNNKLRQHDRIWKNICGYMRWKFYRSI
jgi:hypothetical protein